MHEQMCSFKRKSILTWKLYDFIAQVSSFFIIQFAQLYGEYSTKTVVNYIPRANEAKVFRYKLISMIEESSITKDCNV